MLSFIPLPVGRQSPPSSQVDEVRRAPRIRFGAADELARSLLSCRAQGDYRECVRVALASSAS